MSEKPSIEFQIYDWVEDHYIEEIEDDSGSEKQKRLGEYIIHVFGRTMDGKSVYAKILDFTPYFFIELPSNWSSWSDKKIMRELEDLQKYLTGYENKKIWGKFKSTLISKELQSEVADLQSFIADGIVSVK